MTKKKGKTDENPDLPHLVVSTTPTPTDQASPLFRMRWSPVRRYQGEAATRPPARALT
ncbi:hypothetical protein SISSUDRAFT_1040247 [Sistotremastrum suecicum HHB10207 ss-3]|uniref:Uncharacterized protein n=1 Tax=Sistotremastrum suecicum HHB10207 ss-3 TaxID=1314776 RepID=A0A166I1F3_9AGAM|nr:hypothetical protein SISSUDRAFT_1040247 [Sistotremastrum suecicum HHB10207 ss-3]